MVQVGTKRVQKEDIILCTKTLSHLAKQTNEYIDKMANENLEGKVKWGGLCFLMRIIRSNG